MKASGTYRRFRGALVALFLIVIVPRFTLQYLPSGPEANPISDTNAFDIPYNTVHSAWGDFDLDGDQDLYVVNDGQPNNLYRNNLCSVEAPCNQLNRFLNPATPSFTRISTVDNPRAVILKDGVSNSRHAVWSDVDSDGDLDLYVVNDGMNRLFINNLFSPGRPYDPFSAKSLSTQVEEASEGRYRASDAPYRADFSVRYTAAMDLQIKSLPDRNENMLEVYARDLLQSGVQTPIVFPIDPIGAGQTDNNIFSDPSQSDSVNFITREITPGMFLEIPVADGSRRYVILEVLGPRQLRVDYEGSNRFQDIFRYRILRDVEIELRDTDRFVNDFSLDAILNNRQAYYNYSAFPEGSSQHTAFQLTAAFLDPLDQLLITNSNQAVVGSTLTTLIQVDPKSFGVEPPPVIANALLSANFTMIPRRAGGAILNQKFFRDSNLTQTQLSVLQSGDWIEFLDGANRSTVVTIESVSDNGVIFLDSAPLSQVVTSSEKITYEFIYRRTASRTRRILTDRSQNFGASAAEVAAGGNANLTRNVKPGDRIILDPVLDDPDRRFNGPPRNTTQPTGSKANFLNGQARPGAILEVLEIINANQLLVDAYPSEVGLALSFANRSFPYQIRHNYGRLKKDQAALGDPNFVLFDEFSPVGLSGRNFEVSLGMRLQINSPINPYIVLSNAGAGNNILRLNLRNYTDSANPSNIRLLNAIAASQIDAAKLPSVNATLVPTLEYRPVYVGIGGMPLAVPAPPTFMDKRRLRLYGINFAQLGVARGHEIALLYRTPRVGLPNRQLVGRMIRIEAFAQEDQSVVVEVGSDLETGIYTELEQFCQNSGGACNPADPESINTFYSDPVNSLSVEYEFLTTQGFASTGDPLELSLSNETALRTRGFNLSQLLMRAGDAVQIVPALSAGSAEAVQAVTFTGFVQILNPDTSVNEAASATEAILSVNDASVAPFNVDIAEGAFGIKPIYAGKLNEFNRNFNQVTVANPAMDLTQLAQAGDAMVYFSVTSAGYLTPVTRILLTGVQKNSLTLQRRLDLVLGVAGNTITTNPLYFRVSRATGVLEQKPAFRDNRTVLDFRQKLSLNTDNSVRGNVLLDVYKTSLDVQSPIFKRFKVKALIARNVLELESINPQEDIFQGYFYELKQVDRQTGDIVENNSGNGIMATIADFNLDGIKDLYVLNRATNPSQPLLQENGAAINHSVLYFGQKSGPLSTPVYNFVVPNQSPADQDAELKNRPGPNQDLNAVRLEFLTGVFARAADFDADRRPGLLLLNRAYSDRLFFTRAPEGAADARQIFLRSQSPPDSELVGELFGLNTALTLATLSEKRGAAIADFTGDNRADIYVFSGDTRGIQGATVNRNVFFQSGVERYATKTLFPVNALADQAELGESVSAVAEDFNRDGFMDILLLNRDGLYFLEPVLNGNTPEGETRVTRFSTCGGLLADATFRDLQVADVNLDGFLDVYISKGQATGARNVLCIATPSPDQLAGNVFAFSLLPRNLQNRSDRQFGNARITLSGRDTNNVPRTVTRQLPYSYPHPERIVLGTGRMQIASVTVEWPENSVFSYGVQTAAFVNQSTYPIIALTQPSDYPLVMTTSGSFTQVRTTVASKTTNVEAVGGVIYGSDREPTLFQSLRMFFATNIQDKSDAAMNQFIPRGTVKLYLDNSPANAASRDYKNLVPNGIFDGDSVDWLVSTTEIRAFAPEQLASYVRTLDVNGQVLSAVGDSIPAVNFNQITILSSLTPSLVNTSIVLNPRRDGTPAERVPFLIVYSLDQPVGSAIANVVTTFTPYVPSRKSYGFELDLGSSRFDLTMDVSMLGVASNLPYRAELSSTRDTLSLTVSSYRGVSAQIDDRAPAAPVVSVNDLPASTRIATNLVIRGASEPGSLVQVTNRNNGSTALTVRATDGNFVSVLPLLASGENRIEVRAVDEYGNQSPSVFVVVFLDNTPPAVTLPVVTNINIAKALVSFQTIAEAARSVVVLRSNVTDECRGAAPAVTLPIGCRADISAVAVNSGSAVVQCFESTAGLTNVHAVTVGRSRALFGLQAGQGFQPLGLCPGTPYFVDIVAEDSLGNSSYITNAVAPFITLARNPNPLDSDGDGIPDSNELDVSLPDLDPFDSNDALLDFDGDGINNVEEFKSGTNMYNPFDNRNLPIPVAGGDLTGDLALNPGVVELDASASNLNGLTTREVSYQWSMVSVPNPEGVTSPIRPVINNSDRPRAWFSATIPGIYIVELVLITDKQATTKPVQKRIEIRNLPPRVLLDQGLIGVVNQPILLDGLRTIDPNGETLSWRWVQSAGPSLELQRQSNPALGITSEFLPQTFMTASRVGRYIFELIATDRAGLNDRSQVIVLINSPTEVFPLAAAGFDQVVKAGTTFELRGDNSRSSTLGATLVYLWEPVTDSTQTALPEKCRSQNFKVLSQNAQTVVEFVKARPKIRIDDPGIYAFSLKVSELGRGLESNLDCVRVQVQPADTNMSMPNPQVFSQPLRVQTTAPVISLSLSKALDSGSALYKTPINHVVRVDATESFISAKAPLIDISEGTDATIRSTSDCLSGNGAYPYQWRQYRGDTVQLKPLVKDCSQVSFIPVNPGLYAFELVLYSKVQGVVQASLPASVIVVANDPNREGRNSNRFVPYVAAPTDAVVIKGSYRIQPTCMDEDLISGGGVSQYGDWNYPVTALTPCANLPVTCRISQLEGPPVSVASNSCAATVVLNPGSYRFSLGVFDGSYYSLPEDWYVTVTDINDAAPQANAGVSQTVVLGNSVKLNGSLSISSKRELGYLWRQRSGLAVVLNNGATATPDFIPPRTGQYSFDLRIVEPSGLISIPAEVNVVVQPSLSSTGNTGNSAQSSQQAAQKVLEEGGGGGGGGCFVATAATGSTNSYIVGSLSAWRDETLLTTAFGRALVSFYYEFSPVLAGWVFESPLLRLLILSLLWPLAILVQIPWFVLFALGLLPGLLLFRSRFADRL